MSAKTDRIDRLVHILERATTWVTSPVLAKMLGASERTVRSYISEINQSGNRHIVSCKKGYRLAHRDRNDQTPPAWPDADTEPAAGADSCAQEKLRYRHKSTAETRRDYVLSQLINSQSPLSIFDLADTLYISESTLSNTVLPHLRKLIAPFGVHLETHAFQIQLTGTEHAKRKLLGHLAVQGANGYFTSTEALKELFPSFDVEGILNELVRICQNSELLINNYALNNLLIHLLVIIIRLQSNNELGEREVTIDADELVRTFKQGDAIIKCANDISLYFRKVFGCSVPATDYHQIVLLIALSVERYSYDELSFDTLITFMEHPFVDKVIAIAEKTVDRYGITPFDESFMLQLVLHMYNVYQRALYHVSYPNPLIQQIKSDYAPIYDMAVFFAHRFSQTFEIEIGESEIAFIAFHIGAYIERSATPDDKATCIVIVEQYHDFARQLVADIEHSLEDELNVIAVMSCDAFLATPPECDVVITTIDVPVHHSTKILIGPILTKQNLRKIQDRLSTVLEAKRRGKAHQFLRGVLRPELFCRNTALQGGPSAYIDYLGSLCVAGGFADQEFVRDVHLRERVSSTAFTDCLALPHSIDTYAARSFIAVLHNDVAIPWGRHDVNFVLLIGIAQGDMGYFRDALDIIIELFSSVDETMRLMQTDSFDEFLAAFTSAI